MFSRTAVILGRAAWAALSFGLAGCHGSSAPNPSPASFSHSPYRQPAESVAVSDADREAIYVVVLGFYRPAGQQVRWLDEEVLPAVPGDSVGSLGTALATQLVQAAGPTRFCLRGAIAACTGRPGGSLRLSQLYALNADTVRLAVEYAGNQGPYVSGSIYSGTEVFLVGRDKDRWRILAHVPKGS